MPKSSISSRNRGRLLASARRARNIASRSPCTAVHSLNTYRKILLGTTIKRSAGNVKRRATLRSRLASSGRSR